MSANTMKVVLGIVAIAIAFIMFPIVLDGAVDILQTSGVDNYSGLESVVKIAPLIIFVGLLFGGAASIWSGGLGAKVTGKSKKKKGVAPRYPRY